MRRLAPILGLGRKKLTTTLLRAVAQSHHQEKIVNSIVYIVGLVVIVLAILSFLGLR